METKVLQSNGIELHYWEKLKRFIPAFYHQILIDWQELTIKTPEARQVILGHQITNIKSFSFISTDFLHEVERNDIRYPEINRQLYRRVQKCIDLILQSIDQAYPEDTIPLYQRTKNPKLIKSTQIKGITIKDFYLCYYYRLLDLKTDLDQIYQIKTAAPTLTIHSFVLNNELWVKLLPILQERFISRNPGTHAYMLGYLQAEMVIRIDAYEPFFNTIRPFFPSIGKLRNFTDTMGRINNKNDHNAQAKYQKISKEIADLISNL